MRREAEANALKQWLRLSARPTGMATLGMATLGMATLGIATLGMATLGIATLGIATFGIGDPRHRQPMRHRPAGSPAVVPWVRDRLGAGDRAL